jgi:hypothetical protein
MLCGRFLYHLANVAFDTSWPSDEAMKNCIGVKCGCALACFGFTFNAIAQTSATPVEGERLSQWIVRQAAPPDAYLVGLSWRVPVERASQTFLKNALTGHLMGSALTEKVNPAARRRLAEWVSTLEVTGRVPVDLADPRWLEANPVKDPVLSTDHSVILPSRPATVTVVTDKGIVCPVSHVPGQEARFYISSCQSSQDKSLPPRVWIAQPDGRVQSFGVAEWTAQTQDEPAPGAWLWAPATQAGWSDEFSKLLIEFLATQGPAQNTVARPPAAPIAQLPSQRSLPLTTNDWGGIGLLQTPTARMASEGNMAFTLSRGAPYTQLNFSLQPFDWAELNYRYSSVSGVNYGPQALSGNQSYKDKSIDLKLTVLKESQYLPEVAVGARDAVGTGLFSGEYVVANKRYGSFDWSVGVGWGSLGNRGTLGAPLSFVSKKFNTRNVFAGQGGQVSFNFFRGPAAPFGGVQWHTPYDNLILKAELDGNNYQYAGQFAIAQPKSPLNVGAVYRYSPNVDLTLSLQRGSAVALGLSFHMDLPKLSTPKLEDPALPRFSPTRPTSTEPASWPNTAKDLSAQTGWQVSEILQVGNTMRVEFENSNAVYWRDMLDRATALLHHVAPASINEFHFVHSARGTALVTHTVDRSQWVKTKSQPLLPSEVIAQDTKAPIFTAKQPEKPASNASSVYQAGPLRLTNSLDLSYKQSLGGPDGFLLFQAGLEAKSELKLAPSTWLSSTVNLRVIDNYNDFKYTAPSNLPRVRTFAREYATSSRLTLPHLQLTHTGQLDRDQYFSVYSGYLESMFAGFGAEWLYRPLRSPFAFGVDINAVKQRDFEQRLTLRDYSAVTGHATAYIHTGWNDVLARISVGQYLAKDKGITVDLSRKFSNDVAIGAYATKTNVSSAQFGEGSFDKGIYFSIPFSALFPRSSADVGYFVYNPLIRDGGAKLNRAHQLYDLTGVKDQRALQVKPADAQR